MTIRIEIDRQSLLQLRLALERFSGPAFAETIKPIVQEGAKAVKKDAVANLRRNRSIRSGALLKAIKIGAFRSDKRRGMVWSAVGVKGQITEYQGKRINPSKYAHLVERGFIGNRGPVAAKPFMGPAAQAHLPRCLQAIMAALRRMATR